MGSLSELGPLDPQIGSHPALGLGNAVRHVADLAAQYPAAAGMFAEYLTRSVRPIDLGYYERVVESAVQYAERLLDAHKAGLRATPSDIAHTLVYSYKDHGFVIDKQEAREIFGDSVVKTDTDEYHLGNGVYSELSMLQWLCERNGHKMYWVGGLGDCRVYKATKA